MDWVGTLLLLISFTVLVSTSALPNQTKKHRNARQFRQNDQKCDLICPGQPVLALPSNFLRNCTTVQWSVTTTTPKITTLQATTTEEPEESTETADSANSTERHNGRHTRHHKKNGVNHTFKKRMAFIHKAAKQKLFRQHKQLQNRARLDGCYVICSDSSSVPGGSQPVEPEEPDGYHLDNYVEGEDKPIEIVYVPTAADEDRRPNEIYNNYDFPPYFGQLDFENGFQSWDDKKQKRKHSEKKH